MNRDRAVQRVILIEGAANLAVLGLKAVVGVSTGSLAVLGDALHSLTDVVNNVIALAVIRISSHPPDRAHPYGHRKFETLAVFVLACLLTVLAVELTLHAIRRPSVEVFATQWALVTMLIVLIVNIALATWERRWAERLNSEILRADASHTLADVLTTLAVIGGWQFSAAGFPWLDTAGAIVMAGMVLYLAFNLFRRAIPVLVDQVAISPEQLLAAMKEIEGISEIRQLRSRWIGSEKMVDMVISVDASLSTRASHRIADDIESTLSKRFQVKDIHIHIEPHTVRNAFVKGGE